MKYQQMLRGGMLFVLIVLSTVSMGQSARAQEVQNAVGFNVSPEQLQAILAAHAQITAANAPKNLVEEQIREVSIAVVDEPEIEEDADASMEVTEVETEATKKLKSLAKPKGAAASGKATGPNVNLDKLKKK